MSERATIKSDICKSGGNDAKFKIRVTATDSKGTTIVLYEEDHANEQECLEKAAEYNSDQINRNITRHKSATLPPVSP